jgi:hypothetical protein
MRKEALLGITAVIGSVLWISTATPRCAAGS